jgi:predicted lactoylglutathione lyase
MERRGSHTSAVEQRVSLVTLGVRDLDRARRFYEALGWVAAPGDHGDVVFFQAGGLVLGLWGRDELAADCGVEDSGGWGGIALAHNLGSREEVDALIEEALRAGAPVVRPAQATDWGGYSGGFVDPEGHAWEVAHNPFWTLHPDGSISLERPA